jgi:molecular chaperone DnaJ
LLYHPDKTDNELLKAKFVEIKEAYEVLRDPVKRKNYDLSFDNFSYKKEARLEPHELLKKLMELRAKTDRLDPHRMDLDKLEFELTELLSERNTETLTNAPDKGIVQQFIRELLYTATPLTPKQYQPIADHVYPLADDTTKEKIRQLLQSHTWDNRWNSYKIVFAIVAGILLCLLIYYVGR